MPEPTIELVMTVEEARRLCYILGANVTWRTNQHGYAAYTIHEALCQVLHDFPLTYLSHQPMVRF